MSQDFDSVRQCQIAEEGVAAIERAATYESVDETEVLRRAEEAGDRASVHELRELAAACIVIAETDERFSFTPDSMVAHAAQVVKDVSSGARPYHRDLMPYGEWFTNAVAASVQARERVGEIVEACAVLDSHDGSSKLWAEPRSQTLQELELICRDVRVLSLATSPIDAAPEDLLGEAIRELALGYLGFNGAMMLAYLTRIGRLMYGDDGLSTLSAVMERAGRVIEGGGFAGGAQISLARLWHNAATQLGAFAPAVTTQARAQLLGERDGGYGPIALSDAMCPVLVQLWAGRHRPEGCII